MRIAVFGPYQNNETGRAVVRISDLLRSLGAEVRIFSLVSPYRRLSPFWDRKVRHVRDPWPEDVARLSCGCSGAVLFHNSRTFSDSVGVSVPHGRQVGVIGARELRKRSGRVEAEFGWLWTPFPIPSRPGVQTWSGWAPSAPPEPIRPVFSPDDGFSLGLWAHDLGSRRFGLFLDAAERVLRRNPKVFVYACGEKRSISARIRSEMDRLRSTFGPRVQVVVGLSEAQMDCWTSSKDVYWAVDRDFDLGVDLASAVFSGALVAASPSRTAGDFLSWSGSGVLCEVDDAAGREALYDCLDSVFNLPDSSRKEAFFKEAEARFRGFQSFWRRFAAFVLGSCG